MSFGEGQAVRFGARFYEQSKQLHHEGASWGLNVWKTIITVPQREQGQREASALALLIAVGECGRLS